jgi:GNAT superfamily N-acetyltransferase
MDRDERAAIRVRPAMPDDDRRVAALGRGLSADSLRRRFLGAVSRDFAVGELVRETGCGACEIAFVAEDVDGIAVGEAYAVLIDATSAEAAFVVADGSQHHGVGTLLFDAVVRGLAARGVQTMILETHVRNAAMLGIVRASGLSYGLRGADGTVEIMVHLPIGGAERAVAS